ncbi:heterokaryon incompatibility protein-domain-containing protein [Pestalotiopsis sp. NC0098]|nr:heterokaryon incompatibility protein-domain-containing protein [Pestalotiopsis sp. NC0098]
MLVEYQPCNGEQIQSIGTLQYAIVSHTWSDDEVLFEDFVKRKSLLRSKKWTKKAGAYKVMKAVEQARDDGLDYVWIDTCCIDKSSSAELSEAINSMFKWYALAAVCYAYLSDYSVGRQPLEDDEDPWEHRYPPNKDKFSASRWFRRGWTLQELIAPKQLIFYDKNWITAGLRGTMATYLSSFTSIDSNILFSSEPGAMSNRSPRMLHLALQRYSISQKMSWAANRETAREEDIAYCLLGLFDVNMPLLYGEGPKAFMRLQEELLKKYNDPTILMFDRSLNWGSCTLLAPSPRPFSTNAQLYINLDDIHTFQMTEDGLKVDLLLCPLTGIWGHVSDKDHYLGILDCFWDKMCLSRTAVVLVNMDGDYYIYHDRGAYIVSAGDEAHAVISPVLVDIDISQAQRQTIIIRDTARMTPIQLHKPKNYPLRLRPIVQSRPKYEYGDSKPPTMNNLISDEGAIRHARWGTIRSHIWIVNTTQTGTNHALLLITGTARSKRYFHSSIPNHYAFMEKMPLDLDENINDKLVQRLCKLDVGGPQLFLNGCQRSVVLENGDRITTKLTESCFLGTTLFDIHVKVDFEGEY